MSTNRKTISSKENWQALRTRYTWHLRPPFNDEFDHSHWWKGLTDSEIDPVAALYELARRHLLVDEKRLKMRHASWHGDELRSKPLVGAAHQKMWREIERDFRREPIPILYFCILGLKAWPALNLSQQTNWEGGAGRLKGVDCRDDCAAGDSSQRRSRWWSADVVRSRRSGDSSMLA